MENTRNFLKKMGLPLQDAFDLPISDKRFPDGAQYRIEIPSVEGPKAFKAVIDASKKYGVDCQRISQGSGIMLLTDDEIKEYVKMGKNEGIEVSLFVGPRAPYDIGSQIRTSGGAGIGYRLRGVEQLVYAIEDIKHACDLGIRGVLIADEGLLWIINEMKLAGELPSNLVLKVSIRMGKSNPAAVKLEEKLGADTYNLSPDLTLPQISAIRQAVDMIFDVYIETSDGFGGFVRNFEVPELVKIASPIYLKAGLRNAPGIYPSGVHTFDNAAKQAEERVRRARIFLDILHRYYPEAKTSELGAKDLGIPE